MPRTLTEKKAAEVRRLSSDFQMIVEDYLRASKSGQQMTKNVLDVERVIHELSPKYRLQFGGCPPGYTECADGGCVPRGRHCPILPPQPLPPG